MATRSYLYAIHPNTSRAPELLSQWRTFVPLGYLLLVGADPAPAPSLLQPGEPALRGGPAGQDALSSFLRWLAPQLSGGFAQAQISALAALADHPGVHYQLELGEVFDLACYGPRERTRKIRSLAKQARSLVGEVQRLIASRGSTLASSQSFAIQRVEEGWETHLGLSFERASSPTWSEIPFETVG